LPQRELMSSFSRAIQCRETPMFSTRRDFSSLRAFGSQPEGRQRILAAHLIDLQSLPGSRREALPTLGTNLGQKSIFSLRFQASPSQTIQPTPDPAKADQYARW